MRERSDPDGGSVLGPSSLTPSVPPRIVVSGALVNSAIVVGVIASVRQQRWCRGPPSCWPLPQSVEPELRRGGLWERPVMTILAGAL